MRRAVITAVIAMAVATGCSLLPIPGQAARARACEEAFSQERCAAIVSHVAEELGVPDAAITSVELPPDPTPRPDGVLVNRSGGGLVVRVTAEGRTTDMPMCPGVSGAFVPACMDDPKLSLATPIGNGYRDVPCAGEPPAGCATPIPDLEPEAVEAAQPLEIDRIDIPVNRTGLHEIVLGRARIPNGVLTVAEGRLVDPWPDGVRVSRDGIRLEVRSQEAGRPPFRNVYEHGWWPGTEAVEVVLVFNARHADPGATIGIADLVVR